MKKAPGKRYFSPGEAVKNQGDGKKDFKHKKVGKFRKVQSLVC